MLVFVCVGDELIEGEDVVCICDCYVVLVLVVFIGLVGEWIDSFYRFGLCGVCCFVGFVEFVDFG